MPPAQSEYGENRAAFSDADFAAITALVQETSGIVLGPTKRDLVFGRLNRRLRTLGLRDFAAYRALLAGPDGEAEIAEMINALTTNLTSFFRESHHFSFLADEILPDLLGAPVRASAPQRRLRIWSAACSSGEEPYSIAMILSKALVGKGAWDVRILATDIDTNMVAAAEAGCYEAERGAAIPPHFRHLATQLADGSVAMSDTLKQLIAFKPLNLLQAWPMRGKFDAIFCRNVVIYFDKPTQRTLFDRFADILQPDGWLFIGHSESLLGVSDRFDRVGRTIYRKRR
jgi:chemotaxis protein methyltransferase CheR